ncbi:hypothetical protein SmaMPs15_000081 [Stenotrophomonas maltophilia phage vB_SmaM_Ps15]|uniref:Uncharacterized protein n=1 Tax=Stenotrophomonas maltophilia phage vB_SmaM_Ps15 TaxID=3071007 RepID=A0AAE9FP04_9CAUD|nr:hypothetical protein PQC01_gp081 [Stenotrophomonas maltophilia phage vB_SmaM_Ps15]UMO77232.1 hypothetical protein SmaMPs15_000081 [Stenotrophomonas maltophilia phage vB_SmaM_Ps15]
MKMQTYQGTTNTKPRIRATVVAASSERAHELLIERFASYPAEAWEIEILPSLQTEGVKDWTII